MSPPIESPTLRLAARLSVLLLAASAAACVKSPDPATGSQQLAVPSAAAARTASPPPTPPLEQLPATPPTTSQSQPPTPPQNSPGAHAQLRACKTLDCPCSRTCFCEDASGKIERILMSEFKGRLIGPRPKPKSP